MSRGKRASVTLGLAIAVSATIAGSALAEPALSGCPVTIPRRTVPTEAGFTAAGFNYGGAWLRAALYWPRGVVVAGTLPDGGSMARINTDGSISLKLGWWRGVRGDLVISGRRLDRSAPPLGAITHNGSYGVRGFQPSTLTFPTFGCWRVVGRVGSVKLAFVVKVQKLRG